MVEFCLSLAKTLYIGSEAGEFLSEDFHAPSDFQRT